MLSRANIDTHEVAKIATVLDLNRWLPPLVEELEWPVLPISLDLYVIELATDETFRVENSVLRIGVKGIFG